MHFWSCDITKHRIYKIGHISAIFKDRDFWFGPKNSIKLCAERWRCMFFTLVLLHYFWGHQVHFWSRDCALTIFLTEK